MANQMIRKMFALERKTIDAEAGIFEAMISTEETDRDGDIIRAAGAELSNYLRNPIVLAGHDYANLDSVVGKALEVTAIPGQGLKARFQFAPASVNPKADVVRRLWEAEFLNATSIGFIPREGKPMQGARGVEFTKWELLEFSVVSVPSNQSALAVRMLQDADASESQTPEIGIELPTSGKTNETSKQPEMLAHLNAMQEHVDAMREMIADDAADGDAVNETAKSLAKRGRVLSAANEGKLTQARDHLNDVLAQLQNAETEAAPPEPGTDENAGKGLSADNLASDAAQAANEKDQKEVSASDELAALSSLPAEVAQNLSVELRQLLSAVSAAVGVSRTGEPHRQSL